MSKPATSQKFEKSKLKSSAHLYLPVALPKIIDFRFQTDKLKLIKINQ